MAHVFISYERRDEAIARKLTEALGPGHQVWTDALIPPHRDYADEIQEHLAAAQVVLVLWSQTAANSQWVRAEADYAREHGKLVQIVLDASVPPMPFNRIQCARLGAWNGDPKNAEWLKVLASIEQLSSASVRSVNAQPSIAVDATRSSRFGHSEWIVGGLAAISLAGTALWFAQGSFRNAVQPSGDLIAVLPFDTLSSGEQARYFADGLTDQIVTTLSNNHIQVASRADTMTLREPDRERKLAALGVALLFDGTVRHDGNKIDVKVHLEDTRRHAVLWSKEVDGTASDAAQLQDQIAQTIVGVLACSNRALRPVNGLSDPRLLARYLHACDIFANSHDGTDPRDTVEMLAALREVTIHAPDFAAAHSDLAKFDAYLAPLAPPEQADAMRNEAVGEARRALAIEPKSPDAYLAEEMLLPPAQWAERERLLREGIALDPAWPHTNGFLGFLLADVGRLAEAIVVSRRAAAADLQIDWSFADVSLEAVAGQTGPCIETLSRRLELNPRSIVLWGNLLTCQMYAGHWDAALDMVEAPSAPIAGTHVAHAWMAFFVAMKTRAPADVAAARDLALATAKENGLGKWTAIQDLAALGYVDDAFALAQRYAPNTDGRSNFLFLPIAAPMRQDPRFMKLAARIGLVDYWRTSGHWPDFCSEPGLLYDCRAEADRAEKATPP